MASCSTRISCSRWCLPTPACGSTGATSTRSKGGHARARTGNGGRATSETSEGTGFWHETYFRGGEMESVYVDMPSVGLGRFAQHVAARGSMFSARRRLGRMEEAGPQSAVPEEE